MAHCHMGSISVNKDSHWYIVLPCLALFIFSNMKENVGNFKFFRIIYQIVTVVSGPILKSSLINQHFHPPDLDQLFDTILPPDLNELFVKKKARFNKRTSSAHWDSPILKPGAMLHYNHY